MSDTIHPAAHPMNRRSFLALGGTALAATTAGLPVVAEEPAKAGPARQPDEFPTRALLLSVPETKDLDLAVRFIREDLPKEGVNTLVLRIEFRYQFKQHPELAANDPLSRDQIKQILQACRDAGIKLIPCTNLFAHQSDREEIGPLLTKYPQFDESPDLKPPHPWRDGGPFDFYTKSLCPRHPDLYPVIFSVMDELLEACEADAFHAGMDEVWIIAHPRCPRCGGGDPSAIFARHATNLRNHLAAQNRRLWIWSDRLIDGKTSNLLAWQASMNNTWRAIDLVPQDIVICDWKYEDAPPTPGFFAIKGFDVLTSACYKTDVALAQLEQVRLIRKNGRRADFSRTIASRMLGVFHTQWGDAGKFIRSYHSADPLPEAAAFKALFKALREGQA